MSRVQQERAVLGEGDERSSPRAKLARGRKGASDENEQLARREILDAAATAFSQHGYAATSVDDIAAVLGATKGRIYHYYQNKAQLLLGIASLGLGGLFDRVSPLHARLDLAPPTRLFGMSYQHAMVLMTSIARQKAAIQEVRTRMAMAGPVRQMRELQQLRKLRRAYEDMFVSVIEDGIGRGDFADMLPRMASKHVLGALNGLIVWYQPRKSARPSDLDQIARGLAKFVVDGLRPATVAYDKLAFDAAPTV